MPPLPTNDAPWMRQQLAVLHVRSIVCIAITTRGRRQHSRRRIRRLPSYKRRTGPTEDAWRSHLCQLAGQRVRQH
ncbi:hypothetical protein NOR_03804 [Metarhizium rileyi]|uniref:Uncharacterized protein n=1 Tax=Metarhizium rileyi (strain RCEF 4871) TaxID=1649241 RepID=A0A162LUS7_METRR|nr:hypothetical protein NOR_03804 [Metarhizium rileyi RCEF 4871]